MEPYRYASSYLHACKGACKPLENDKYVAVAWRCFPYLKIIELTLLKEDEEAA
jgi:hypothetical protein